MTWHLADSLPQSELGRWKEQRDIWLSLHPKPWDEPTRQEYIRKFTEQIEAWLDAGAGSCLLNKPTLSEIVVDVLMCFNRIRYIIDALVVMPNHVHVLFQLSGEHSLEQTIKSWKGVSARRINQANRREGVLWTEDYWDTIVRNPEHLERCRRYINQNPVKAGLKSSAYRLYAISGDKNVPGP